MKKREIFDLLFKECKDYLRLNNWNITFNFNREKDNNDGLTYDASLKDCDYTHFSANITYNNEMWAEINKEGIDSLILLTFHEMLHIFTGGGTTYLHNNKEDFYLFIGSNVYNLYYNHMLVFEEQMTNIIDKVIFEGFTKTKGYKEIKSKIKLLKKG